MQCGSCAAQAVPILMNPAVWLLALAAIASAAKLTTRKK